jgi:hypothetical protein
LELALSILSTEKIAMNKIIAVALACVFTAIPAVAQEKQETSMPSVLREFTRSGSMEGLTLSFVLLNDKTVEMLFQAPGKYSMRARANQATTFYIQGVPDKDVNLDNKFVVEQDGQTFNGSSFSIKNFEGGKVSKGQRIDGILQLDKKLNLNHAFTIKNSHALIEFKLSDAALKELQN